MSEQEQETFSSTDNNNLDPVTINPTNNVQPVIAADQTGDDISNIKAWAVVDKKMLKKGESYIAAIKVRLDQTKLPKPVQVEAIGSDDWSIASERYRWTPVLVF